MTKVNSNLIQIFGALLLVISFASSANAERLFDSFYGKDWSANIGFGSSKLNNFVGLSREFPLDRNWNLHLGCGLGEILVGGGVVWHQNPGREGIVASFNAGFLGVHADACYQFEVGSRSFLVMGIGLGSGSSFVAKSAGNLYPIISYEYHFKEFSQLN